jgi:hypothetical protein
VEFNSAGNHVRGSGMDSFPLMVHQFLPASDFEFPKEKVGITTTQAIFHHLLSRPGFHFHGS